MNSGIFAFLKRRDCQILTALLILQNVAMYMVLQRKEIVPVHQPLASTPNQFGGWQKVRDNVVEKEVQEVLKSDDLLNRTYASSDGQRFANLFVAYFESQRTGKAPHSPKNCLPGAGWTPYIADEIQISIPGNPNPITVNRYVIQKGNSQSVVLYWYHSYQRIVASEYAAKIWLVLDSIRLNRSDTALVRVVMSSNPDDLEAATQACVRFVQASYPSMGRYLP
jgi:EpsI family protein